MARRIDNSPLVSIVLPTYNRAALLPQAIRSVLNQSYANLELIVVDDNSPDDTAEVVKTFSDPRIRYVRNEPNLKLPRALNKGFSIARGDLLTWTSDDNLFTENAIERMVDRLGAGNCDFVYADYYLFSIQDEHERPLDCHHDHLPDAVQLERGNHIGACFMYTRRVYEEIGEYDPELFLVEDYDYFIRVAQRFKLCHIPEPLYYFRRDENTLYLSRYAKVKASDVLVRYKNNLLNEEQLCDAIVQLLLLNIDKLSNPLLRWTYKAVYKLSFRLTKLHRNLASRQLRRKIRTRIRPILEAYTSGNRSFGESRDALSELINETGRIEYVRP